MSAGGGVVHPDFTHLGWARVSTCAGCTVLTQDTPCVCTVSQDVPRAQTYSPQVPAHSCPALAHSCQLPLCSPDTNLVPTPILV